MSYEKRLPDPPSSQWEKDVVQPAVWTVLEPDDMKSTGGATLTKQAGRLDPGERHESRRRRSTRSLPTRNLVGITGIRLEVLTDPSLPGQGPGPGAATATSS